MSARVWDVEELDRVHPLPEGWYWRPFLAGTETKWSAVKDLEVDYDAPDFDGDNPPPDEVEVCVGPNGNMRVHDVPDDVVLAVILASKGFDSMEAMAEALDGFASHPATGAPYADGLRVAVSMLRRGTVKP